MYLVKVKFRDRPKTWYVSKIKAEHPGNYFSEQRSEALVMDEDEKLLTMERLSSVFGSELEIWSEAVQTAKN